MSEGSSHETDVMESTLAVIGLSGRFAGANHVDTFWQNIRNGVESIQRYNDSDLLEAGVPRSLIEDPDYVKAGAPLRDMEKFDGGFFGFTPLERQREPNSARSREGITPIVRIAEYYGLMGAPTGATVSR